MAASVVFLALGILAPVAAHAATAPDLGTAASYAVFGKAGVTNNSNVGTTHIWGDVGADAMSSITNLGVSQVGGAMIAPASGIQTAATAAYGALDAGTQGTPVALDLAGTNTVTPGVYTVGASTLNGTLTLNGPGVYIFRSSSSNTTGHSGTMVLENGATSCNVFWEVSASMTIGTGAHMVGTIIANSGLISLGTGAVLEGRAFSLISQVTLDSNQIIQPSCTAPATLHVVKLVVGGTATASAFTIHVKDASSTEVGGGPFPGVAGLGTAYSLPAGTYSVSEAPNSSYVQTFSGSGCDVNGNAVLSAGQDAICTVVNTAVAIPTVPSVGVGAGASTGGGRIIPLIGIVKVPTPLALPTGTGQVVYNYTVWNVGGQQALDNVSVTDDKCTPVSYVSGDVNGNSKLDPHENWKYSCITTLSTTTTNTAVATGYSDDTYHQASIATALATVVVGSNSTPPLINVVKVPSRLTPFPAGGGNVTYTYTVTNPGVVALHNVGVTDNKCAPVSYVSGDTNHDGLLAPGESWIYTCNTNITASTMNTATAEGTANGFTAIGYAFATVLVAAPGLPNTGFPPQTSPWVLAAVVAGALATCQFTLLVVEKIEKRRGAE